MQGFPHRYSVTATTLGNAVVELSGDRLPSLSSAPPLEFDGPGDKWSPETLFVAAIADCYVLTFCATAAIFRLPWSALRCHVDGVVDRAHRITQFTEFMIRAQLTIPTGSDSDQATRLLEQAKNGCLVTNSLKALCVLEIQVDHDLTGVAA